MKLLAINVLYNPDDSVAGNIYSYLPHIDKLLIWRNSPVYELDFGVYSDKVVYLGDESNRGLGHAYNEGIKYAVDNGFSHLLTMDQDSTFVDGAMAEYKKIVQDDETEEVVGKKIFSVNYTLHGKPVFKQTGIFQIECTVQSGCIFPVSIFSEIGAFRDDFFIDGIDCEFSLRAKRNGIATFVYPNIILNHNAGYQKKKHKFLWKTFYPNEYSPARNYYIIRNNMIVSKLYPESIYNKEFGKFMYYFFWKRIIFILMYEEDKYNKIKGLLFGFFHGLQKRTGEQTIFK